MILRQALTTLRSSNVLSEKQHGALLGLMSGTKLSLFWEIHALFYVGVMSALFGMGVVIKQYFITLGPLAVILGLSTASLGCLIYCWLTAPHFRAQYVPSRTPAFDYILYAGCALFLLNLGAIETQYQLLQERWDRYLLLCGALFTLLAYRFDNKLVLSLALSTIAAWCGFKFTSLRLFEPSALYPTAIAYGVVVAAVGLALQQLNVKKHFIDVYLNIALNVLFIALLCGMFSRQLEAVYMMAFVSCAALTVWHGVRTRRFLYVMYAVIYGYLALSAKIIPHFTNILQTLSYLIISSVAVLIAIVLISRRFREHA